ncbi:MAG: RNA polymerase subunit sigma-24 [Blastopirellula sp.]|nr:MAG: RNA polymerase subunit sigma-24 [Blastopirellula sp.]
MNNQPPNNVTPLETRIDIDLLLQENNRWLRIAVYTRLRDPIAVDDVMQEVAVAVVKGIDSVRDVNRIRPWLYQVAIRQTLLYRRKLGRQRKAIPTETNNDTDNDTDTSRFDELSHRNEPTGIDWLISEERQQMIQQTLAELPRRDAEILLLKYIEGWKYQQIAEHLGLSTSAIEARLHRARSRMREKLTQKDIAPA